MNKFVITDFKTMMESSPQISRYASIEDPYMSTYETYQSFEITLRPAGRVDKSIARKLNNVIQAGKTVELNTTEYADFVKPYKNEFIEFMTERYPDRLLGDPKAWDAINNL